MTQQGVSEYAAGLSPQRIERNVVVDVDRGDFRRLRADDRRGFGVIHLELRRLDDFQLRRGPPQNRRGHRLAAVAAGRIGAAGALPRARTSRVRHGRIVDDLVGRFSRLRGCHRPRLRGDLDAGGRRRLGSRLHPGRLDRPRLGDPRLRFRCRLGAHFCRRLSRRRGRERIVPERIAQRRQRGTAAVAMAAAGARRDGCKRAAARIGTTTAAAASSSTASTAVAAAATAADAAMPPRAASQVAAVKQTAAATAAATHVARQQAIEHPADATKETDRMQRPAGAADVIAIGLDGHGGAALPVGHHHVVPPLCGWSRTNDRVRGRGGAS
jgi:hypothetical protein